MTSGTGSAHRRSGDVQAPPFLRRAAIDLDRFLKMFMNCTALLASRHRAARVTAEVGLEFRVISSDAVKFTTSN